MGWPEGATHCKRGHELNEQNIIRHTDDRRVGGRVRRCGVCLREIAKDWEAANVGQVRVRQRARYRARQNARGVTPRVLRALSPEQMREAARRYNTEYKRAWRARQKAKR